MTRGCLQALERIDLSGLPSEASGELRALLDDLSVIGVPSESLEALRRRM